MSCVGRLPSQYVKLWNPVKELKVNTSLLREMRNFEWNPVKELKVSGSSSNQMA